MFHFLIFIFTQPNDQHNPQAKQTNAMKSESVPISENTIAYFLQNPRFPTFSGNFWSPWKHILG